MKKFLFSLILLGSTVNAAEYYLSEDFAVYIYEDIVLNWQPDSNYEKTYLPTFNYYEGTDGGYVAIYTRDKTAGIYDVGNGIYVMGQIRVQGHYEDHIFIPKGYASDDDITQDPALLEICASYFPATAGRMWVGGDTGGWFDL